MSTDIPTEDKLRLSPLAYYVRVALVEIGFQYRAEKQWAAWEAKKS